MDDRLVGDGSGAGQFLLTCSLGFHSMYKCMLAKD